MAHFQTHGLRGVAPRNERKGVIAKIRSKSRLLPGPVDRLEPENALSKIRCLVEIACTEAHVTQLLKHDHPTLPKPLHPAGLFQNRPFPEH